MEKPLVVRGHCRGEESQGAHDDAEMERHVLGAADGGGAVMGALGPLQATADGADDLLQVQLVMDVELRGEADLDVAHALGEVVLSQFAGDALKALGVTHDGARAGKAAQVFGEVGVVFLEYQLLHSRPWSWTGA